MVQRTISAAKLELTSGKKKVLADNGSKQKHWYETYHIHLRMTDGLKQYRLQIC